MNKRAARGALTVRCLLTVAMLLLSATGLAQSESAEDSSADESRAEQPATGAAEGDSADDTQAEDELFDDDDELLLPSGVFKPSERIEADSEVSLPSDI